MKKMKWLYLRRSEELSQHQIERLENKYHWAVHILLATMCFRFHTAKVFFFLWIKVKPIDGVRDQSSSGCGLTPKSFSLHLQRKEQVKKQRREKKEWGDGGEKRKSGETKERKEQQEVYAQFTFRQKRKEQRKRQRRGRKQRNLLWGFSEWVWRCRLDQDQESPPLSSALTHSLSTSLELQEEKKLRAASSLLLLQISLRWKLSVRFQ